MVVVFSVALAGIAIWFLRNLRNKNHWITQLETRIRAIEIDYQNRMNDYARKLMESKNARTSIEMETECMRQEVSRLQHQIDYELSRLEYAHAHSKPQTYMQVPEDHTEHPC